MTLDELKEVVAAVCEGLAEPIVKRVQDGVLVAVCHPSTKQLLAAVEVEAEGEE